VSQRFAKALPSGNSSASAWRSVTWMGLRSRTMRPATVPREHGKRTPISRGGTAPQWAAERRSCPSSSKIDTSSASQKRAALLTTASRTGWSSVREALMILRTSAVAVCCSRASFSSRVSRATSVSWSPGGLRRTTAFGALLRFSVADFRCRFLTGSSPALERRRIAFHPRLKLRDFGLQ
jgi:hypothetical protein